MAGTVTGAGDDHRQLNIFFFPYLAPGHMVPFLHLAKLFASQPGVKSTIVTTDLNRPFFAAAAASCGDLEILVLPFPTDTGLPEGCQNLSAITSRPDMNELIPKLAHAVNSLRQPLEDLMEETRPDCLVADMFYPWATDSAARFGIPRLVFHGKGFFALCAEEVIRIHRPDAAVSSDSEAFSLPADFPDEISFMRKQLPHHDEGSNSQLIELRRAVSESELTSYGVIVNSFYELESDYADYYRRALRRRAWHVGPVSLVDSERTDQQHDCLKWLDSKQPGSVIYACFGSMTAMTIDQLREIATGLESSGQHFIWVVRRKVAEEEGEDNWLPEQYENKIEGKGLIIQEWAPQVAILGHVAVGGFVTHCGWNSTLEGISAGKPMVTWPMFAEQFFNEKLVTEVLRTGVGVGVKEWVALKGEKVNAKDLANAVKKIMGDGVEAEEMRKRANKFGELARKAVEKGGSSHSDLNDLMDKLRGRRGSDVV
ncbi:Scopoletin glucosyltransferase [Linum perenne]